MAAIPGFRFDITGASGSQGLLSPKSSWRAYVFPRGAFASQDSAGSLITFDTSTIASRFAVNNWIQVGTDTAKIVKVTAVGGNSITVTAATIVTTNDRIFLIGNTQPSVTGGSATYITPNTLVRQRSDDSSTLYPNSMITTNSNGLVQGYASPAMYDVLVQDGNQSNQGYIADLMVGVVEGVSVSDWAFFGSTVTFHAAVGITGTLTVGTTSAGSILSVRGPGAVRYASRFATGSNTGGIHEAIADLPAQGGKVILDAGTTYTMTVGVSVSKDQVHVQGAGPSSVIVQTTNATDGFILSAHKFVLSDLTLRGTNVAGTARAVSGGGNSGCVVERCVIEQWGGIGVNFGNNSYNNRVGNNIIRNGWNEGMYFGIACSDNIIEGNLLYGNSKNAIDCLSSRTVIRGNVCRNTGAPGDVTDTCGIIVGYSATDVTVSGNVCDSNVQNGIFIWGGSNSVSRFTIAGNVCLNSSGGWGIEMIAGTGVTISECSVVGNVCHNNAADGIAVNGVIDSTFTGNVCFGNSSDGMQMYATSMGCSRNVVIGNVFRGNSGFGFIADHANVTGNLIVDNQITGNVSGQIGTISSSTNKVQSVGPQTSTLTQAASLALGAGDFFGISGTLGAGTSISNITPQTTDRRIVLWAAAGTMGFSISNTLRVVGNSINVPVNGAVECFCTGTTWFVFSPSS